MNEEVFMHRFLETITLTPLLLYHYKEVFKNDHPHGGSYLSALKKTAHVVGVIQGFVVKGGNTHLVVVVIYLAFLFNMINPAFVPSTKSSSSIKEEVLKM